jgi:hypothetical protein
MNTAQGGCLPTCLLACLLTCCTTVRGGIFCNCKSRSAATRLLSPSPLSLHLQLLHMSAPPGHSSRAVGAAGWGHGLACRRRKRSGCDESSRREELEDANGCQWLSRSIVFNSCIASSHQPSAMGRSKLRIEFLVTCMLSIDSSRKLRSKTASSSLALADIRGAGTKVDNVVVVIYVNAVDPSMYR